MPLTSISNFTDAKSCIVIALVLCENPGHNHISWSSIYHAVVKELFTYVVELAPILYNVGGIKFAVVAEA